MSINLSKLNQVKVEKILDIPYDEYYASMQGGCTDGQYSYCILNAGGNTPDTLSKLLKIDLKSGEIVQSAPGVKYCHANDMTYDSKNKRLVICHNTCFENRVSFIDPSTLACTGYKDIEGIRAFYAIAYDKTTDRYAIGLGGSYDIGILNHNFELVKILPGVWTGYTKQGVECDEKYIYFIQSVAYLSINYLIVYDWDGNLISKIQLPVYGESEHIFTYGERLYAGISDNCHEQGIYQLQI